MESVQIYAEKAWTLIQATEPLYLAIGGAVLFLLLLIPIILRSVKKSKANKVKPDILLKSFQISPLGRDAWIRFRNEGDLAVLKDVKIKKRKDLTVKSDFREVAIQKNGTTSLFLNALGDHRIREDFELELLYSDSIGNLYRQRLRLSDKIMLQPKLL